MNFISIIQKSFLNLNGHLNSLLLLTLLHLTIKASLLVSAIKGSESTNHITIAILIIHLPAKK